MTRETDLLVEDLEKQIKAIKWHILKLESKLNQIKTFASKTKGQYCIPQECFECH